MYFQTKQETKRIIYPGCALICLKIYGQAGLEVTFLFELSIRRLSRCHITDFCTCTFYGNIKTGMQQSRAQWNALVELIFSILFYFYFQPSSACVNMSVHVYILRVSVFRMANMKNFAPMQAPEANCTNGMKTVSSIPFRFWVFLAIILYNNIF